MNFSYYVLVSFLIFSCSCKQELNTDKTVLAEIKNCQDIYLEIENAKFKFIYVVEFNIKNEYKQVYMSDTETTYTQYYWQQKIRRDREIPINNITISEAQMYAEKLNNFIKDGVLRLPTKDEWLSAAYGMNKLRRFPWGNVENDNWYNNLSIHYDEKEAKLRNVANFPSSSTPDNIHDLWGNLY